MYCTWQKLSYLTCNSVFRIPVLQILYTQLRNKRPMLNFIAQITVLITQEFMLPHTSVCGSSNYKIYKNIWI